MNACTADGLPMTDPGGEIVRLKAKVNAEKGTGTLTGTSFLEGNGVVMTCKLKYKRVNTTPGKLGTCAM
jgi:hypothetical protein